MPTVEEQWEFVLDLDQPAIRVMAKAAAARPNLRRLFPYASLNNLRFSHRTTYPYDPLPYIQSDPAGEPLYQLRDSDHRPLARGTLESIVELLSELVESRKDTADEE